MLIAVSLLMHYKALSDKLGNIMMKKIICTLLAACFIGAANATPLTMSFDTTDLGGKYQYDFTLTLDNHDNSWVSGNQWDWIIFGDTDSDNNYIGFDTNGGLLWGTDWTTLSSSSSISSISISAGDHNGPYLAISTQGMMLPGWLPTFVGESISWSGTSSVYIPSDELRWSSLIVGGGAEAVHFEQANQVSVPEPGTFALIASGVLGFSLFSRRKKS